MAADTSPAASGSFSYTAGAGEGSYSFYTIATERRQRRGRARHARRNDPDRHHRAELNGERSGVGELRLDPGLLRRLGQWRLGAGARSPLCKGARPGELREVASDTSGNSSGSFSYTPAAGNGNYNFYTLATDKLGHVQAAPATPNATTNFQTDVTALHLESERAGQHQLEHLDGRVHGVRQRRWLRTRVGRAVGTAAWRENLLEGGHQRRQRDLGQLQLHRSRR